jgi:acetoacetyl-CoA synthetase
MAPPDPAAGPRWFPGARLNFAENLLRRRDGREAVVAWNEAGRYRSLTGGELFDAAMRFASALRTAGVGPGDRVAGFLPNIPEAVIAMLATASLGAVWSSCSPDFGAGGVLDRFGQIAPKVLVVAASYRYNGKRCDCLERAREVAEAIHSIEHVVVAPYLDPPDSLFVLGRRPDAVMLWDDFVAAYHGDGPGEAAFERLPFDHPLYVMYSSGTTGLPKCMVHSAGGTLVQHVKEHALHCDIGPDDRVFYFTTCGWMMWNWLASVLAQGATIVLYDGSPMPASSGGNEARGPSGADAPLGVDVLWDMAQAERLTVFGTSAKYLALAEKRGVRPRATHELPALRTILSTGSPLAAHSFDYVYDRVKPDVHLASISGGTDIISCFVGGVPALPVRRGEIQAPGLAMAVEVWDPETGERAVGNAGELVCTRPFPSMPVGFWNDPDGSKYFNAYFATFDGVWRHGDWTEERPSGGYVIHGRSDATLNPGGVRIGTAEIYRVVEQLPEVVESLAVGQELPDDPSDVRVVLFVRLREGLALDDGLRERIRKEIRERCSPHHVPKVVAQVGDIPRTISNKISELAVREVIHGRPVKNVDALANPESLDLYRNVPELRA